MRPVILYVLMTAFYQNLFCQHKFGLSLSPISTINNAQWSVAGNIYGENPNILSEVIFRNNISVGTDLKFLYGINNYFNFSASYTAMTTIAGNGTDTDYHFDNREGPSYELFFENRNGHVNKLEGSVSYNLILNQKQILSIGIESFAYRQKFGIQSSENSELNSYYLYRTQGLGLKLQRKFLSTDNFSIRGLLMIYRISTNSYGSWNLRTSLNPNKSFVHKSRGASLACGGEVNYKIDNHCSLFINYKYRLENTSTGFDYLLYLDGGVATTQFNGSRLRSNSIQLGLTYWR